MKIAIIPARGGSKRIPKKNIRLFAGKPIIEFSIEAALECGVFDEVYVSTDCPEISSVARRVGASVPFLRPEELSTDVTPTRPVIQHCISWVNENVGPTQFACCILPTAPLLEQQNLSSAFDLLVESSADFVVSVASYPYPPQRSLRVNEDGRLEMVNPDTKMTRSQDLETLFHDAGLFYWGSSRAFLGNASALGSDSIPFVLPRFRAVDIDTPEDWDHAEALFKALVR